MLLEHSLDTLPKGRSKRNDRDIVSYSSFTFQIIFADILFTSRYTEPVIT